MPLSRSVQEILADHLTLEVEGIDRSTLTRTYLRRTYHPECRRWNHEEVDRDDVLEVVVQERTPAFH